MPFQDIEHLKRIRERLRNTKAGRRKNDSIASLVELLRKDIEEQRARGVPWRAIATAILEDETKHTAVRSAYQRLPKTLPDKANQPPSRKPRTKAQTPPPNQDAPAYDRPAFITRFSMAPIVDTYGSDENH